MITAAVLDKVLGLLAPLFRDVMADDDAARAAARATLDSYAARDDRKLRFAALSIAFSFGALDALSRAVAPDLPPNQVLRLRGNANVLNRAALQNEARLEKARRQDPAPVADALSAPAGKPGDALLPSGSADADVDLPESCGTQDLVDFVRAAWQAEKAAAQPAGPVSRQQRRLAERQAQKQRQRELEQERLAQRAAQRDAVGAGRLAMAG